MASWTGTTPFASKKQLVSSISGLYNDLQDLSGFDFQNLNVSTLNALSWVSTPILYVSDIRGYSVDISGISSVTANFSLINTSSIGFTAPTIDAGVKVSVDFSLGDFVWNALVGTGAMVAEVAVGVGVGAGGFFYAIANGASALMNTKELSNPTYINTSNFEVVGSSTQLQVSTLGDAYPVYSSIMRVVSSITPNQQPGVPGFTSTLFYPGQICIRSISDPIPIVTSSSNVLGSTLQQFGEWVPLLGLEPENIEAQSISTVNLKADNVLMTEATTTTLVGEGILAAQTLQVGVVNAPGSLLLPYESDLEMQLGATSYARLLGAVNYWYHQSDQDIVWTKFATPGVPINMQLSLGSNAHESYLQVSSILSRGNIQANSGYFSSMTVESLTVLSTINTTSTNVENITSSATVIANTVFADLGVFSTMAPFQISSSLGIPYGLFDISKTDSVVSTTYNQVSSLTQNILSYTLNTSLNDMATFNIGPGTNDPYYRPTPQNVSQWGSTILIYDNLFYPGVIDLGWVQQWDASGTTLPGGATFDVYIQNNSQGFTRSLSVTENSNQFAPLGTSTLVSTLTAQPGVPQTFRFTLPPVVGGNRNGWWNYVTPAGAPYVTSNTNTLQIYQDMNDSYIQATDRLHLVAGDIYLDGALTLSNFNVNDFRATTGTFTSVTAGVVSTPLVNAGNVIVNPVSGGFDSFYSKPSTISFISGVQSVTPIQSQFLVQSPDYIPIYTLLPPFMGSNQFTSYNYTSWNQTIWNNTTAISLGAPGVYLGDVQTARGSYAAKFWINNTITSPSYALNIYTITTSGSNLLGIIPGGNYGLIQTTDGSSWTLNSNSGNPQGIVGGNFSNITTLSQSMQGTTLETTQNLFLQSPNQTVNTGTLFLYADQIRTNSRRYGSVESAGIASFPIGIENTVYQDNNISWTFVDGTLWQSDATNVLYNVTGSIFYDVNSWIVQVIPSRFRTNNSEIVSWDVQPTVVGIGGGGFCWAFNRYILVDADVGGPGSNANNWNWILAIPKNYCTYV